MHSFFSLLKCVIIFNENGGAYMKMEKLVGHRIFAGRVHSADVGLETVTGIILVVLLLFLNVEKNIG